MALLPVFCFCIWEGCEAVRSRINVIIVHPSAVCRSALQTLLLSYPIFSVTNLVASSTHLTVDALRIEQSVVLLSVAGSVAREIVFELTTVVSREPVPVVVLLDTELSDNDVRCLYAARARSVLYPRSSVEHLCAAIQQVANHGVYYAHDTDPERIANTPSLSNREKEIFTLLAGGMSGDEIAARLYISPKTVRNHISNVMSKLKVKDRTQACLLLSRMGVI